MQGRHGLLRLEQQRHYAVGILRIETTGSLSQNTSDRRSAGHAIPGDIDAVENVVRGDGTGLRDQEILGGWDVLDIADQLSDFDETATLIGCLDLIITVDTSVAHLAGGLGRPVWILLPYRADYRWLLDRADSPWYPTARLFRQDERRDYRWVVDQVRGELADVVDGFREGLSPSYGSFGGVPRNPIATT